MQERNDAQLQRQAAGARTPEELSTQLEDAFIVGDPSGLGALFDEHAVLSLRDFDIELRRSEEIAMFVAAYWATDRRYLAQVRRVVQAGDMAAVVGAVDGDDRPARVQAPDASTSSECRSSRGPTVHLLVG